MEVVEDFTKEPYQILNKLYNLLDLYVVSSRIEGGPQAVLECAVSKTPIISTDVGVASEILSEKSIFSHHDLSQLEISKVKPDIDRNYKDFDMNTPLHYASEYGHFECIIYLVKEA